MKTSFMRHRGIRTVCRHFPLDRPCAFHKRDRRSCDACRDFEPLSSAGDPAVLIIKLGAMGDVLRTTFLLGALRVKYPRCRITWLTAPASAEMLTGCPVDRIWIYDRAVWPLLLSERFGMVINLDLSPESLALATLAPAARRVGYWLGPDRRIMTSGAAARDWLAMSASDTLKKDNTMTYQHWMARIAGVRETDGSICVSVTPSAMRAARAFTRAHGLAGRTVVGINPGAGGRWKYKRWTMNGYRSLIRRLHEAGRAVVLLGGPEERDVIERLTRGSRGCAINAGTGHSIQNFFALLALCDLVVTGDTMALHAAAGLGCRVVAIFGPTSSAEIELYGRGVKVITPAECACCYLNDCSVRPTCMQRISVDEVAAAADEMLEATGSVRGN